MLTSFPLLVTSNKDPFFERKNGIFPHKDPKICLELDVVVYVLKL